MLLTCLIEFLVSSYVVVYDTDILQGLLFAFSFETINFTGALEIVVTVCSSNSLNSSITYYIFCYRRVLVSQRH